MPESKSLVAKLAEITGKVGWVEKTGHNAFQNYDYVTEADMVATLRDHLSSRGILIYPQVEKVDLRPANDKGFLATIEVSYFVTDGNEQISVRVAGMGYDNPGDKAVYKAMTGAEKYALKQLFLIPTGDDPERDEEDHRSSGPAKSEERAAPSGRRDPNEGHKGSTTAGTRSGNSTADRTPSIKFGAGKGKALSQASESELVQWTKAMEEAVRKNDPKWHKSNVERLEECKAEWAKRQPWRDAWKAIKEIGQEVGLDDEGCQVILTKIGYDSAEKLTPASVTEFRNQLEAEST